MILANGSEFQVHGQAIFNEILWIISVGHSGHHVPNSEAIITIGANATHHSRYSHKINSDKAY